MSLTFGYDLKDGDRIIEASDQFSSILRPLVVPARGALVNAFPICAVFNLMFARLLRFIAVFSAPHPFVGPILQLQTISSNR